MVICLSPVTSMNSEKTASDMKRVVKYTAIDPYYQDFTETYIGSDLDSLDAQQYEVEKHIGREHPHGIDAIYKHEIILEG